MYHVGNDSSRTCNNSYAGMPISEVFEADIGLGGVLSLLWFRRRLPDYATKFIEMILMVSEGRGRTVRERLIADAIYILSVRRWIHAGRGLGSYHDRHQWQHRPQRRLGNRVALTAKSKRGVVLRYGVQVRRWSSWREHIHYLEVTQSTVGQTMHTISLLGCSYRYRHVP